MYYAPRRRTIHILEIIDMLPDIFNEAEKNKYLKKFFTSLLSGVSYVWKRWCRKDNQYYGQKARHVSLAEMMRNIFTAYHATVRHLKNKGTYTDRKNIIMKCCIVKVILEVLLRCSLESLGIWSVLRYIKHLIKG